MTGVNQSGWLCFPCDCVFHGFYERWLRTIKNDMAVFLVLAGSIGGDRSRPVSYVAAYAQRGASVFDVDVSHAVASTNHESQSGRALAADASSGGRDCGTT